DARRRGVGGKGFGGRFVQLAMATWVVVLVDPRPQKAVELDQASQSLLDGEFRNKRVLQREEPSFQFALSGRFAHCGTAVVDEQVAAGLLDLLRGELGAVVEVEGVGSAVARNRLFERRLDDPGFLAGEKLGADNEARGV